MKAREGLTFKVELRDEKGNVVGETDAVTLKGLLTLAHEDGLRKTKTKLTQKPTKENGNVAIAKAMVRTLKGRFSGIGDASPDNVEARFAMHLPRIAETRALARALRIAVNIGEVALEELGAGATIRPAAKVTDAAAERAPRSESQPKREQPAQDTPRATESSSQPRERERRAMSDAQRKLLFRLAFDLGATDAGGRTGPPGHRRRARTAAQPLPGAHTARARRLRAAAARLELRRHRGRPGPQPGQRQDLPGAGLLAAGAALPQRAVRAAATRALSGH